MSGASSDGTRMVELRPSSHFIPRGVTAVVSAAWCSATAAVLTAAALTVSVLMVSVLTVSVAFDQTTRVGN